MRNSNKRKGTYHECWWTDLLNKWGWKAKRQPMSGQLEEFPGDILIQLDRQKLIVESKYQTDGKGWSFINKILRKNNKKYAKDILVMKQRSGEAYLCVNINNKAALKILRRIV